MHDRWKSFSRKWNRLRRHSSPTAVHEMRSACRRLSSSICVAALSAGVPTEKAARRLEQITGQLGPLRDNYVYRKTLARLKSSDDIRPFSQVLDRQKSDQHKKLDKFFRRHRKRSIHRRITNIEGRLHRVSRGWAVEDYHSAFEKVLLRQYEALSRAHRSWEDSPDNKRFHRMRVELRDLRYICETIAEVLGASRTHHVHSSLKMLKSLQTKMGKIHDIYKLRKKLVAWVSSRPVKKRVPGMKVATELQEEIDRRMVEFKDHSLAPEELLPDLDGQTIRGAVAANASN